ncbi:hypothetical protein CDAR_218621 [Caerostris darwini]|uniref:Uncharacterized protein n=1 Tax=Caerostris darwini TaxID=1538125 RepID=A0AAV4VD26_9ARAC|nr:hypothetical protein CDAR_218621 [Caerostris darwini]
MGEIPFSFYIPEKGNYFPVEHEMAGIKKIPPESSLNSGQSLGPMTNDTDRAAITKPSPVYAPAVIADSRTPSPQTNPRVSVSLTSIQKLIHLLNPFRGNPRCLME